MSFFWLRTYLPRSLYGRAALILLVPVVSLQLLVSVVFIQRHFNSVTEQMTGAVAQDLAYLTGQVSAAPSLEDAEAVLAVLAPALSVQVDIPWEQPVKDAQKFNDLTSTQVMRVLYAGVPGLVGVDLTERFGAVVLGVDTAHGLMRISFSRTRLSASNPHQLLVIMVLFGIFMTLISYVFLRNQLRPITRLAHASKAFGRGEVLPYHVSGATEVRAAGKAFLAMRARIERQIEQRTLMLSGVSHDLRTPLTRLKLGLSMMPESDERAALERDVIDMQHLVDEFLSFARSDAEGGVEEGDTELVDPAKFLRAIAKNAVRAGQAVTLGDLATLDTVQLRPLPVTRALENLLSNAARYASKARLGFEADFEVGGGQIRFMVEDDGPGIAPDKREQALKPFTRLDKARNQDKGSGVGLGLAIAADIARSHGGVLILGQSADLGGLRAELRLPIKATGPKA